MNTTTYAKFRPTALDHAGLGLPDRQDWLVVPVCQTRDSEALDRSNFRVALERLGGESDTVEVHRFGHWGPGWYEVILAAPSRAAEVEAIADALADYPVLSDEDCSELEAEDHQSEWDSYAWRDFVRALDAAFELATPTERFLRALGAERLSEAHADWSPYSGNDFRYVATRATPSRSDLAAFVRRCRKAGAAGWYL